jgi:hypothetical protein
MLKMIYSTFNGKTKLLVFFLLSFSTTTIQAKASSNRGDPKDYPAYADSTVSATTNAVSIQSCSGCGNGSCVYNSYVSYDSEIDNKAHQGIFYLKDQKDLSCNFFSTYFSGYVCPCKSVCGDYTTYLDFLDGYCKKFITGGSTYTNACKDYLWNCCAYPYYCGNH